MRIGARIRAQSHSCNVTVRLPQSAPRNFRAVTGPLFQLGRLTNSEHHNDDTFAAAARTTLEPSEREQVVDAPEWIVRSQLPYDHRALLAQLDANCTDGHCW
jgi:hypothetical protein